MLQKVWVVLSTRHCSAHRSAVSADVILVRSLLTVGLQVPSWIVFSLIFHASDLSQSGTTFSVVFCCQKISALVSERMTGYGLVRFFELKKTWTMVRNDPNECKIGADVSCFKYGSEGHVNLTSDDLAKSTVAKRRQFDRKIMLIELHWTDASESSSSAILWMREILSLDQGGQLYPMWWCSTPFRPFVPHQNLYLWGTRLCTSFGLFFPMILIVSWYEPITLLAMTARNFYLIKLPPVKSQVEESRNDIFLFQETKAHHKLLL